MAEQLTNNQVLLKECINQEFAENGGYATVNDFY